MVRGSATSIGAMVTTHTSCRCASTAPSTTPEIGASSIPKALLAPAIVAPAATATCDGAASPTSGRDGLRGDRAVFARDELFDLPFGGIEASLPLAGEPDALFKDLERLFERDVASFEPLDDAPEALKNALKAHRFDLSKPGVLLPFCHRDGVSLAPATQSP